MWNKIILPLIAISFLSCKKEGPEIFIKDTVDLQSGHSLVSYISQTGSQKYFVLLESGLGDDHSVWQVGTLPEELLNKCDVVLYDRGGYGESGMDDNPRDIDNLRQELEIVVSKYAGGRKVILIGHSLGGLIIRDFAIKNPTLTAGILFVDPSHEDYNQPTQSIENSIYEAFLQAFGENFGGTREAQELIEGLDYIGNQGSLPEVPVIVITSMTQDAANTESDQINNKTRQDWYNAHESLKAGVSDFTHIQTLNSGHYIMKEEPDLVLSNFNLLFSKLP